MFETFALQIPLDGPIFILKKELLSIPLFGWYLRKIGAIAIVRETTTKENLNFFDKVKERIEKSKRPLLIFPQGTRVKLYPCSLREYKKRSFTFFNSFFHFIKKI